MKAALIKTDGTSQEVTPKGKEFTLKEMYELIGCDSVEHLDLVRGVHMWVDETGRLDGKPSNTVATAYFHKAYPPGQYDWTPFDGPYDIVGNALIIDNTKAGWL